MEDCELIDTLKGVLQDLKDNKYSVIYFKDIIVSLLQMKHNGFEDIIITDYVEEMKSVAEISLEEIDIERLKIFTTNKEFLDSYNRTFAPVLEVIYQKKEKSQISKINECFETLDSWSDVFYEYCEKKKNEIMTEHKFFSTIDINKLFILLKVSNTGQVWKFLEAINLIYNFSNLNDYFKSDTENLNYFMSKFNTKTLAGESKTKLMALKSLNNKLLESMNLIAK